MKRGVFVKENKRRIKERKKGEKEITGILETSKNLQISRY